MSVLDTKSELRKVHLSRNDLLGHRVDAQGARVTGLNTPALQEKNQQPPPVTQSARTQNTSQGKMLPLPPPDCQSQSRKLSQMREADGKRPSRVSNLSGGKPNGGRRRRRRRLFISAALQTTAGNVNSASTQNVNFKVQ